MAKDIQDGVHYFNTLSPERRRQIISKATRNFLTSPQYLAYKAHREEEQRIIEPYRDRTLTKLVITD